MAKQKGAKGRYFLAATGFVLSLTVALPDAGLSTGLSGGSNRGSNASQSLAEVEARIAAQDFGGAISLLERIVKASPGDANALQYLGYSHRALGDYEAALDYYLRALAVEPMHVRANEYLGELHLEMGDVAGAEERLLALTKACAGCAEQIDLERKIRAYKRNNQS
ncbi:tetratricopeptide repeat protein [Rhodospirillaceae bacterium SYSU D60014]|uniref:tetratricopeptide repeat protein n=1 Tax=Virgifigura deserti TaxID=2268457 RepID=UPI0013C474A7